MTELASLFFIALNLYIQTFQTSPPASFINNNAIPLDMKVEQMTTAVENHQRIQ
jgi:hypothetical protein